MLYVLQAGVTAPQLQVPQQMLLTLVIELSAGKE
jgi:hypothetical protein